MVLYKAQEHLRAHPEVLHILGEVISRVELPKDGSFLAREVDMGRIVGRSGCVETPFISLNEPALFAQRIGRERASRVLPAGIEGPKTAKVALMAFPARGETSTYILVTCFVGALAPREPWDPLISSREERQECLKFWCSHALTYDSSVMGEASESSWEEILH